LKIALVGDSVFDNKVNIGADEKNTIERLGAELPGIECVLVAVDGSVTKMVTLSQIPRIPDDTTYVFACTGSNDLPQQAHILTEAFGNEAILTLRRAQDAFYSCNDSLIRALRQTTSRFAVFAVYAGSFSEPQNKFAEMASSPFNDVIHRVLSLHDGGAMEIRDLFDPIMPSSSGSEKIAKAISTFLQCPSCERCNIEIGETE
jgi:hypothetical protein